MKSNDPRDNSLLDQCPTVLVAVDFSQCCRLALKTVRDLFGDKGARFILLHVVDSNFIQQWTRHRVEDEGEVKKRLFLQAKAWLEEFVKEERLDGERVKRIVSEGVPFLEAGCRERRGHDRCGNLWQGIGRYGHNVFREHRREGLEIRHSACPLCPAHKGAKGFCQEELKHQCGCVQAWGGEGHEKLGTDQGGRC